MEELLSNWTGEKIGELPYIDCSVTNFRKLFSQVSNRRGHSSLCVRNGNSELISIPVESLIVGFSVTRRVLEVSNIHEHVFNSLISSMNSTIEQKCINALNHFSDNPEAPRNGIISITGCNVYALPDYRNRITNFYLNCSLIVGVY